MNTKLLTLRDALRRQLAAIHLRDWLPSRGNLLFTLLVALCLIAATTSGVLAAPQRMAAQAVASTATIPYQGRLADASGAPLSGTYILTFRLYNVASGGSPLWEEIWIGANNVQVTNGLFNVMLGSITPISQSLFTGNSSLWLGIAVGSDAEMTPRVQLGSASYAFQSGHATVADLAHGLSAPDGDPADVMTVNNDGNVVMKPQVYGLDINLPDAQTHVQIHRSGAVIGTAALRINQWYPTIQLDDYANGAYIQAGTYGAASLTFGRVTNVNDNPPTYSSPFVIIGGDGKVGIGANPSNILTIQQGGGNVLADGYSVYSSGRWKENVAPIGDALSIVRQLRGVTFDWKGSGKHDLGLIAEEVGKVLPQVVTYEANGQDARAVDYSRLVAVLVQANKEQQQQITSLQEQNAALDARLAALERSGPAVGLFPAWDVAVILALAGGLLLVVLIAYRFRSRLVGF